MSTTDDSEEDDNKIPGSTEDDYAPVEKEGSDADAPAASAPQASATQAITSTVIPKSPQTTQPPQLPKVDPTDIINQPAPAVNSGDLEKPETLTPPQESDWLPYGCEKIV